MTTQHNKSVDAIRTMALQTGACRKINRVQDFPELIKLMFTPQGNEVDGGVNLSNVEEIMSAGANIIVAGSAVFNGDVAENTQMFLDILNS